MKPSGDIIPKTTLLGAVCGYESSLQDVLRFVLAAVLGSLAIWGAAKVQVPFYPVPMTLQTGVILALGAAYGWRLGVATVLLYLFEGALGLPVFSGTPEKGIGLAYMMGPTGGYLLGYVFTAGLSGYLAEHKWDRNAVKMFFGFVLANAIMYIPGLLWLGVVFGWDKPLLEWGLTPFILGDLTKAAFFSGVLAILWSVVPRNRSNAEK